jgi:hypothetical protein
MRELELLDRKFNHHPKLAAFSEPRSQSERASGSSVEGNIYKIQI